MPNTTRVGEFSNFIDAAKEAVDKFQEKDAPVPVHTGRPRYCKSATFTEYTGGKTYWATLWRIGPESEEIACDDVLVKELKELAEQGPEGGVKEINKVKWMFESTDRIPRLTRNKNFPK